jgi:hypothetical protein
MTRCTLVALQTPPRCTYNKNKKRGKVERQDVKNVFDKYDHGLVASPDPRSRRQALNVQRRDTGYVCHVKPLWDVERVAL